MNAITYPARPRQGGPLDIALRAGAYRNEGDQYYFEPKYNGWRALVHVPSGAMFNRHGESLSISKEFGPALAKLRQLNLEWLDCEALDRRHDIGRGTLIVLDYIPQPASGADKPLTYKGRRYFLEFASSMGLLPDWETLHERMPDDSAFITMSYKSGGAAQLWEILQQCNAALGCTFFEGVVAKRADSEYPIQLTSDSQECPDWIKHRFTTK
jgi:hypothetical protein